MKEELERLRTLIEQLAARLQAERSANAQLRNRLAAREAELERTKGQLSELRRKVNGLLANSAEETLL